MATALQTALAGIARIQTPDFGDANKLSVAAGDQIASGLGQLQRVADDQTAVAQQNYDTGVERNTQGAMNALDAEIRRVQAAGGDINQVDPSQFLQGLGNQVDQAAYRQGSTQAIDRVLNREQEEIQNARADEQLELSKVGVEIQKGDAARRNTEFLQLTEDRADLKAADGWAVSYKPSTYTSDASDDEIIGDTVAIRKSPIIRAREQLQLDINAAVESGELSPSQASLAYDKAMGKIDTNYQGTESNWSTPVKGEDDNLYAIDRKTGQTKRIIVGSDGGSVEAGYPTGFTKKQIEKADGANSSYLAATSIVDTLNGIDFQDVENVGGFSSIAPPLIGGQWTGNSKQSFGKFNQLFGQQFLDGVQDMRGLGSLSNAEGAKVIQASNALVDPETGQMNTRLPEDFIEEKLIEIYQGSITTQAIAKFTQERGREPNANEYDDIKKSVLESNPLPNFGLERGSNTYRNRQTNNETPVLTTTSGYSYRVIQ